MGVGTGGAMLYGDIKLFDSIGSAGVPALRGAVVAFGNTRPAARARVLGLRERGVPSDGHFKPHTGEGYVHASLGDYAKAIALGVDVRPLLFETLGGFSPEVMALLSALCEERANRLHAGEYDATTWAARSWMAFSTQKLSVALHRAAALEIAAALGLSAAADPRSD